jgi:two-component system, NarL family, nitrate/nitrite response regulator NarL
MSLEKTHKIIIIEDHLLFAQGLQMVLEKEQNYAVVGIVSDLENVISSLNSTKPDIVLLDVNLNGKNSKETCEKITNQFPNLKVIVISMHHEYSIIKDMKKAGAKGYVLKNDSQDQIFEALEKVIQNQDFFVGEVGSILSKGNAFSEFSLNELNPREKKVLNLILKDKTNKKIAEELGLSIKTIEFYRTSLYIKLDVKNIIQLVQKIQKMDYWDA